MPLSALWRTRTSRQLREAQEALREARDRLEERVAERTAELARANEDLRRQHEALQDADRQKDQFLAVLAHELRNPVHAIRTSLALLIRQKRNDADTVMAAAAMDRQVDTLARLLEDLLDVVRVTQKGELSLSAVDLRGLVSAAVEATRAQAARQGQRLSAELAQAPVMVKVEPGRMEQVFTHLLLNAIECTDAGGRIEVCMRCDGGEASVAIRDSGMGIEPAELPRIFQLFARGERVARRAHGSLGIGLHVARQLVEAHGGRLEAASEGRGKGSKFTVWLPAAAQPGMRAAPADPLAALPALRLLVVDDNRDAANTLSQLLRSYGHEVHTAYDGTHALEKASRQPPQAVLLDIGLPDMDGYEVARQLRQSPAAQAMLVALTGWGSEADKRRAAEAGFHHHLTKPVDYEALAAVLARAG